MNKKLQIICLTLFSSLVLSGQNSQQIPCATIAPPQQWEDWMNEQVVKYKQNLYQNKTQQVQRVIPVVVHIISNGATPIISNAQVQSQIDVLNADFAGIGLNASNVPSAFSGDVVGNTGISFCLATKDQNGVLLANAGIDPIDVTVFGLPDPAAAPDIQAYINGILLPVVGNWPPDKYFNIWVSNRSAAQTITGFATYPPGTGMSGLFAGSVGTYTNDGIWVWSRAFGTMGTAQAPYDKGRTATHEVAHWLGVRHLWGDGNCLPDYCDDTPIAKTPNTGCLTYPANIDRCGTGQSPNGEMFMNFMDMTDDPCRVMFTKDQNIRMQTALSQSPQRNLLGTHDLCAPPVGSSVVATASFAVLEKPCLNRAFTPFNLSSGFPYPSYLWSSSPPVSFLPDPTVANPSVVFNTPGNYTLTLVATNTVNSSTYTMAITSVGNCTVNQVCLDSVRTIRVTDSLETFAVPSSTLIAACGEGNPKGSLAGTNCYKDRAFAQFYKPSTYSLTPYPQVHSVIVLFDNMSTQGLATSPVTCKIYGGSVSSGPAAVMASKTVPLSDITGATNKTTRVGYLGDPNDFFLTNRIIPFKFDFDVPVIINMPSNGFFAGVDISNMASADSIRLFTAKTNSAVSNIDSSAWVLNSLNNWRPFKNYRGKNVQLAIIPQITCSPILAGIKESQTEFNSNIAVVPNPNNGMFSLIFTLPKQQDIHVKIYNIMGQIVSQEQLLNVSSNVIDVNLSNKPEGIYFAEISNGTERVTKKVIVTH